MGNPKISIIIPTLNEEKYLSKTIDNIFNKAEKISQIEILVIDAGSSDETLNSVSHLRILSFSKPLFALKKYESLNFGISQASAKILIFLDADTLLPAGFDELILKKLKDPKVVGGAFEFSFENPDWKLWSLQMVNRARYRIDQMYFGDQAVFCKRQVVENIGGYPENELMESAYFCRALRKEGVLALINKPIITSPRRFLKHGFFKVFWFDFSMWIRFVLNISVEKYANKYWSLNLKEDG